MSDIISGIGDFITGVLEKLLLLLPDSPFQTLAAATEVQEVLGWINYVFPIAFMLSVLQLWIVAVGGFYIWQVALRWLQAIE